MTTVFDIRRENLKRLIDEYAGGNVSRFADLVGLTPAHVLGIVGAKRPRGTASSGPRNIGDRLPRKIEHALGLEVGWMDQSQHGSASGSPSALPGGRTREAIELYILVEQQWGPEGPSKLKEFLRSVSPGSESAGKGKRTKRKTGQRR